MFADCIHTPQYFPVLCACSVRVYTLILWVRLSSNVWESCLHAQHTGIRAGSASCRRPAPQPHLHLRCCVHDPREEGESAAVAPGRGHSAALRRQHLPHRSEHHQGLVRHRRQVRLRWLCNRIFSRNSSTEHFPELCAKILVMIVFWIFLFTGKLESTYNINSFKCQEKHEIYCREFLIT